MQAKNHREQVVFPEARLWATVAYALGTSSKPRRGFTVNLERVSGAARHCSVNQRRGNGGAATVDGGAGFIGCSSQTHGRDRSSGPPRFVPAIHRGGRGVRESPRGDPPLLLSSVVSRREGPEGPGETAPERRGLKHRNSRGTGLPGPASPRDKRILDSAPALCYNGGPARGRNSIPRRTGQGRRRSKWKTWK